MLAASTASATLIVRSPIMVYDNVLDVTWLRDFNYPMTSGYDADGLMTWDSAYAWAQALTVGGYSDWRLPTFDPYNPRPATPTPTNEFGSLWRQLESGGFVGSTTDIQPFFNLPYQSSGSEWYWTGLEGNYLNPSDPTTAWRISMNCACWDSPLKTAEFYAMAVRSGDVTPVPEPATFFLLGAGFLTMGATLRRRTYR